MIFILPNYPPKGWSIQPRTTMGNPLKIVYVGALSLDTMYVENFADWVLKQSGRETFDLYSTNVTRNASEFFNNLNSSFILS